MTAFQPGDTVRFRMVGDVTLADPVVTDVHPVTTEDVPF